MSKNYLVSLIKLKLFGILNTWLLRNRRADIEKNRLRYKIKKSLRWKWRYNKESMQEIKCSIIKIHIIFAKLK